MSVAISSEWAAVADRLAGTHGFANGREYIEWLIETADYADETEEETVAALEKSIADFDAGRSYPVDEAFAMIQREIQARTKQPA